MQWRRRLITLHRDIGYLCSGLILVYAISGVAVNHRHHWNYNQSVQTIVRSIGSAGTLLSGKPCSAATCLQLARSQQEKLLRQISRRLGHKDLPAKAFWRGPRRLSLFFGKSGQDIVDYDPVTGQTERVLRQDRLLLRQLNFLHLNEAPTVWTWIADIFALSLIFLVLSGATIVKGKKGIKGRGGLFVALGLVLPLVAYLLLRQ